MPVLRARVAFKDDGRDKALMDIGQPVREIIIEPRTIPVPSTLPMPQPAEPQPALPT